MTRTFKALLTAILLLHVSFVGVVSVDAQKHSSKPPKYLPDSISKALCRITLEEVAGSYVKVESIKLIGEEDGITRQTATDKFVQVPNT